MVSLYIRLPISLRLIENKETSCLYAERGGWVIGSKLPRRKKFSGRVITWDHKHRKDKVSHYEYQSARQLLEDFWTDVRAIMASLKR